MSKKSNTYQTTSNNDWILTSNRRSNNDITNRSNTHRITIKSSLINHQIICTCSLLKSKSWISIIFNYSHETRDILASQSNKNRILSDICKWLEVVWLQTILLVQVYYTIPLEISVIIHLFVISTFVPDDDDLFLDGHESPHDRTTLHIQMETHNCLPSAPQSLPTAELYHSCKCLARFHWGKCLQCCWARSYALESSNLPAKHKWNTGPFYMGWETGKYVTRPAQGRAGLWTRISAVHVEFLSRFA